MRFKASEPLSIGVELELQLLDGTTLDAADGIIPLMEFYPQSRYVKPEFIQNTVEIASKVCSDLAELESHVRSVTSGIRSRCKALGMTLCGGGSHPFSKRLAEITPTRRYLRLEKTSGYLGHIQLTFALHVHLGMPSGEEAVTVLSDLKPYLPLLLAMSASSPFWHGYDTGYVSYRHRILAATRSYGVPPSFAGWEDFTRFFEISRRAGIFETIKDIHWDIRPHPNWGTLEVRVMDMQSTIGDAVALAGFVRALVLFLQSTRGKHRPAHLPKPLPWWTERENHFQASRLGLTATYVVDEDGTVVQLADMFDRVTDAVAPVAHELGQGAYLERLRESIKRNPPYDRQRAIYHETGSLQQVAASLVDALEQDTLEQAPACVS
jgi:carboxylate-amine ligase